MMMARYWNRRLKEFTSFRRATNGDPAMCNWTHSWRIYIFVLLVINSILIIFFITNSQTFCRLKTSNHPGTVSSSRQLRGIRETAATRSPRSRMSPIKPEMRLELRKAAKPTTTKVSRHSILHVHPMTKSEKAFILDLLDIFVEVCDRLNITYQMYGGTLLGSWRHHGLIPWDDDVDVVVLDFTQKNALYLALRKLGGDIRVFDTVTRLKLTSIKAKKISNYRWFWPYIDIQFFRGNDTHFWDAALEFQYIVYKRSDILPCKTRPFEGRILRSPNCALNALQTVYGETDSCSMNLYSHKYENVSKNVFKSTCELLRDSVPFVYRRVFGGLMEEILAIGNKTIQTVYTNESYDSVTSPFSLRRLRS